MSELKLDISPVFENGYCEKCGSHVDELYDTTISKSGKKQSYRLCKNCAIAVKKYVDKSHSESQNIPIEGPKSINEHINEQNNTQGIGNNYINVILDKINKAKTASLIGMIASIIGPVVIRIIQFYALYQGEIDADDKIFVIVFTIIYTLFLALNVFSFVVLFKRRKNMTQLEESLKIDPSDTYRIKSLMDNVKYNSVKTVMILNIVVSALMPPLVILLLAQIISCYFIKELIKFIKTIKI